MTTLTPPPPTPRPAVDPGGHWARPGTRTREEAPPGPLARARWRRRVVLVAGATAAGAALGIGVLGGLLASGVPHLAVDDPGRHPFMSPVGTDRAGVVSLAALSGPQPGDRAELYAQVPGEPACDAEALLGNLRADGARAAAWARVLGVAPERVAAYVRSLTPVTLRADTAVVDHGWVDGTFEATPTVLAAGSAVFVDSYGAPTVRCASGDPLTPGTVDDPTVTVVSPTLRPIATTVFHDPSTGTSHQHPGRPPQHEALSGTFAYDGSVLLSDGRLLRPDGTIVDLPAAPAGSTPLPGGGWEVGGQAYNADGTPRPVVVVQGYHVQPDGTLLATPGGTPVDPPPGHLYRRNYDGSISVVYDGPNEPGYPDYVLVFRDGVAETTTQGVYDATTGTFTDADGDPINHPGTPREDVELPDGGVLTAAGEVTAPQLEAPQLEAPAPARPGDGTADVPAATETGAVVPDAPAPAAGAGGDTAAGGGTTDGAGSADTGSADTGSAGTGSADRRSTGAGTRGGADATTGTDG